MQGWSGGYRRIAITGALAVAAVTAACGSTPSATTSASATATARGTGSLATSTGGAETLDRIVAPPGWTIALWAVGGGHYSNPDAIDVTASSIWVAYQNASVKDGSNNAITSTVVEYTLSGSVTKTWPVPGHVDGLRIEPSSGHAWVTSNEDGGPLLNIIDPASATPAAITLAPTAHGGGYDDIAFVNGTAFVACSNPTLDANGNNVFPAVDKLTVTGTSATVTPVLMGNAKATDAIAGGTTTLNLTDPDSFTIDPAGDLVLVSQADSALITIANPGSPAQAVTKIAIGDQVDDTVWTTANSGRLFIVDAVKNAIYTVRWSGPKNIVFSEAPNDSGVASFVGTVDLATGFITPVITGLTKPTGLVFVPGS